MALSYRDVLERYDRARAFGVTKTLPEFAQHLNELTGTNDFSEGLRDGLWTNASTRADQILEGSDFGQLSQKAFGAIGGAFGHQDAGERVGRGIPRMVSDMALGGTAGAIGMGVMMGGHTYAETGSPAAGVTSGIVGAVMPKAGEVFGSLGAQAFGGTRLAGTIGGKSLAKEVGATVFPETADLLTRAAVGTGRFVGSQVGMGVVNEGGSYVQSKITGSPYEPFGPDFWLNQIPFSVLDAVHAVRMPRLSASEIRPRLDKPVDPVAPPAYKPPTMADVKNTQIDDLITRLTTANGDAEKSAAFTDVAQTVLAPETKAPVKVAASFVEPGADGYRAVVAGKTVWIKGAEPTFDGQHWIFDSPTSVKDAKFNLNPERWNRPAERAVDPTQPELPNSELPLPSLEEGISGAMEGRKAQMDSMDAERQKKFALSTFVQKPMLNEADMAALPEMGVRPETIAKTVAETSPFAQVQFADNSGVKDQNLHGTNLEATNPLELRVAAKAPDGAVVEGKPGELHMHLTAPENSELGFVDKAGKFLSRTEAFNAQQEAHNVRAKQREAVVPEIKQAVARHELATVKDAEVRQELATVPTTEAELDARIPAHFRPIITEEMAKGATQEQAIETALLQKGVLELDAAQVTQKIEKAKVGRLTGQERQDAITKGAQYLDAFQQIATLGSEDGMRVIAAVRKVGENSKVIDPKVSERVLVTIFKWRENGGSIADLERSLAKTANTATMLANRTAKKVPETPIFDSREAAQQWLLENPEHIRSRGMDETQVEPFSVKRKTTKNKPARTEWTLRRRIFADDAVSMNQAVGDSGAEVGDFIPDDAVPEPQGVGGPRTQTTKTALATVILDNIDHFTAELPMKDGVPRDPDEVAMQVKQFVEFNALTKEKGAGTPGFLDALNERLASKGLDTFDHVDDAMDVIGNVDYWIGDYNGKLRSDDLGSQPIYRDIDLKLHEQIPFDKGVAGVLDWISQQTSVGSLYREFANMYKGFVNELSGVRIVKPGDADHSNRTSFYFSGNGWDPIINLKELPTVDRLDVWARTVLHETTHHMAESLVKGQDARSVEFRARMEEIRDALVKSNQLPKKVKELIARSLKDDHIGQYRKGDREAIIKDWKKTLGDDFNRWYHVVYGVQDIHETLAQAFSKPFFVDLMENTMMPKRVDGTALGFLSRVWNKLVGRGMSDDSAMANMLKSYDNYLSGGVLRRTYNGVDLIRDNLMAKGTRPEALASRMGAVDRTYARGTLEASLAAFNREGEAGLLPVTSPAYKPVLTDAKVVTEPAAMHSHVMGALAEDVPVLQSLYNRMRQDHEVTKEVMEAVKTGELFGDVPKGLEDNLKKSAVVLNAMKVALDKQTKAIARYSNLKNFSPEGLSEVQADGLRGTKFFDPGDPVGDADELRSLMAVNYHVPQAFAAERSLADVRRDTAANGAGLDVFTKNFMLTQEVKRHIPAAAPVIDDVNRAQAEQKNTVLELNTVRGSLNGKPDGELIKGNNRVLKSPVLSRAASDVALYMNQRDAGGFSVDYKDPYIRNVLRKLNAKDQAAVQGALESENRTYRNWTERVLPEKYRALNTERTGMIIAAREVGMLPASARDLTKAIYSALDYAKDPQQLMAAQQMLKEVAVQMKPDTFQAALQHATTMNSLVEKSLDFMSKRPHYISEQRFKDWHLVMRTPTNESFRQGYATEGEARKALKKLQDQGYELLDLVPKSDANTPAGGISSELMSHLQEMDVQAYNMTEAALKGVDPNVLDVVLSSTQRASAYQASAESFKPTPGITRLFKAGREGLNMLENSHEFYERASYWLRHNMIRATTNLDMLHPEVAGNRGLREYLDQHVKNYLTPDNNYVASANKALYYSRLALNFGNMILEGFQTTTTGMQSLISETGSVLDSAALLARANKEYAGRYFTKDGKWSDADHKWFADYMERHGHWDAVTLDSVHDVDHDAVMNMNRTAVGDVLAKIRSFSSIPQRYNDKILSLAAFKLGREQGMTNQQAADFAVDKKNQGLYTAGKQGRSVGLWSIKTRAVPQIMSSLQGYTQGWFSQMVGDAKIGFGKGPKGTTPAQQAAARKAFVYGIVAQGALAGALGLPGVGQGMALVQQATGFDTKGWLRANLGKLFNEDQETGGLVTSMALSGSVASLTGLDPSGRAAISVPFIGVDPYKGFNLSNFAGALGNTASDYAKALIAMAGGDFSQIGKLQASLKGPAELISGDGALRDARGTLLQELKPWQRWAMAAGLTPTTVQARRDMGSAVDKMNRVAQRQQQQLADQVATLFRQNDVAGAQKLIFDQPAENRMSLVESAKNRVLAQTNEYDWRRELNPAIRLNITTGRQSNEVARLQQGAAFEQAMGAPGNINGHAMARAAILDSMMNSNPYLGLPQARKDATELYGKHRRGSLPLPAGYQ